MEHTEITTERELWSQADIAFAGIELGREFITAPQDDIVSAVDAAAAQLPTDSGRVALTLAARKILRHGKS